LQLTTHAVFAFAIGLIFFGRPDIAFLVTLGALVPDLDREYWFVKTRKYQDEQPHRARFHNVFIMAIGYLLSPFFALGIFLHALQDSFTTAKDRGAEWFFPLTRLIKRGTLDAEGNNSLNIEPGKIYLYQEDPKGLIEYADPDLQEPDDQPTPWRRVYGPALNSCLLDRGFLFGSILLSVIWLLTPNLSHAAMFNMPLPFYYPFIAGFAFFGLVYLAGELDRRDRKEPLKIIPTAMIQNKNIFKKPIFAAGLFFLGVWLVLYRLEIWTNLESLFANWVTIVLGTVAIALMIILLIKVEITRNKKKGVPVII
jgi:LexA-binding, inner membrane-associated putative hydrolase